MRHIRFVPVRSLVAVALLAGSTGAMAQSTTSERSSWIPGTHEGYVGFNAGVSDFTNACIAGYPCDDRDVGFKVYAGGQLYRMLGLEAGYVNFGSAERAGGVQRAQG
ncbi:MAG: hypothetical protein KIT73_18775, partial [Burkholderiales bacterium]|nr:hypothetical protein [Burkholderiales bacterium]